MKFGSLITGLAGLVLATTFCGCGSSGGLGSALTGLNQIPSSADMLRANSSSTAITLRGIDLMYTGTPPNLVNITQSNADAYFYNGLVAQINGATLGSAKSNSGITSTMANQFWGGVDGGPAAQGGCQLTQAVGEAVSRMQEQGSSACYMKNMPSATGVVITPTPASTDDVFRQDTNDKLVLVHVTNMQNGGGGGGGGGTSNMDVYIRVQGSATAGNAYKATLTMCSTGGTPNSFESFTVDRSTGLYTASRDGSDNGGVNHAEISAYLTAASGSIAFDLSKDRSASMNSSYSGGRYAGKVIIGGDDVIRARRYSSWSFGGQNGIDKNYAVTQFSGSGLSSVKFLQGAFRGLNSYGSNTPYSYVGTAAYSSSGYYKVDSAEPHLAEATAEDFSTDTFFTGLTTPTFDSSTLSCSGTPDYTIAMDFSLSGVAAVKTQCEADRYQNYDICYSNGIQSAQQKIFNYYNLPN